MENKIYTGIGSRQTPQEILEQMTKIARTLAKLGWTLRSGGAAGADTAFEKGATSKEIFLPWKGFNGNSSELYATTSEAKKIAKKFHPAWERCNAYARAFHTRNVYQVLGYDLQTPTKFILCWHNESGGTLQACRIAEYYRIPIFNMKYPLWKFELIEMFGKDL